MEDDGRDGGVWEVGGGGGAGGSCGHWMGGGNGQAAHSLTFATAPAHPHPTAPYLHARFSLTSPIPSPPPSGGPSSLPTPDVRLYHRAAVVPHQPDMRGLIRNLSIDTFHNEARRVITADSPGAIERQRTPANGLMFVSSPRDNT